MIRRILLGAVALAALSCDRMDRQPRYDSAEPSSLFADGTSLQAPPQGVVARDDRAEASRQRPAMTMLLLERGRERYAITCVPCHDASGYGRGTVPSRGYPQPPSFHGPRLRAAPAEHVVEVITKGFGAMYGYADRVAPADRWAIAAYVRALQLSQDAPESALSPQERAALEAPRP